MAWEAPNCKHIVDQVDYTNPGLMKNNDIEFCKAVIHECNKRPGEQGKWGLNGKRGNPNDPSRDVVAFLNAEVPWGCSIVDIIGGHDNNNPNANPTTAWIDQTRATYNKGEVGVFIPVSTSEPGPIDPIDPVDPVDPEPIPVPTEPCKFNDSVVQSLVEANKKLEGNVKTLQDTLDSFMTAMLRPPTETDKVGGHINDILQRLDRNFNKATTPSKPGWWPF